jgi:hypothetical protein
VDGVSGALYAGSASAPSGAPLVFRRERDADAWIPVNSPQLGSLNPTVRVWTDGTGAVYAGGGNCIMLPPACDGSLDRSEDRGATWIHLLDKAVSSLAIDPFDPDILLAVYYEVVPDPMYPGRTTTAAVRIRSIDRGTSWQRIPVSATAFAFDPTRPGVVLAATPNDGAWRSVDSGASWQAANDGLTDTGTRNVAVDGLGNAYLATQSAVFVSRDGGLHWSETALTLLTSVLAPEPTARGGVYVGSDTTVFHLDASGGVVPVGSDLPHVRGLALSDRHLWAATTEGVFELDLRRPGPRVAPERDGSPPRS